MTPITLVILNLSEAPISDYSLTLESGPLGVSARALPLLGPVAAAPIVRNGGFESYRPVSDIQRYGTIIIDLT